LLVGGSLRVYYITSDGREATLYHVEPGGTCILALTSAFNREPYPAWVEAGPEGGSFVRVPSAAFRRLFDAEPEFRGFLFGVLSRRVLALMQTLEEIGSAQIEQRVARFLLRQMDQDLIVRASQSAIASELGTAREVVFRALRSLCDQGLVRTGRLRIQVIDPAGLRRVGDLDAARA
jgi:CRP/FNR family transcriptional regulator